MLNYEVYILLFYFWPSCLILIVSSRSYPSIVSSFGEVNNQNRYFNNNPPEDNTGDAVGEDDDPPEDNDEDAGGEDNK